MPFAVTHVCQEQDARPAACAVVMELHLHLQLLQLKVLASEAVYAPLHVGTADFGRWSIEALAPTRMSLDFLQEAIYGNVILAMFSDGPTSFESLISTHRN